MIVPDFTPERLAEIARVTDAATPGPWVLSEAHSEDRYRIGLVMAGERCIVDFDFTAERKEERENAAFVSMARTAIPDLLAALTAKDEEIARLRARFLESCKHQRGAQRHIDDLEVELFQVASERDLARQQVEELRKALDHLEAAMDKRFDDINDPDWGAIPSEWWEARATGGSIIRYVVQQELTAARQLLVRIETP